MKEFTMMASEARMIAQLNKDARWNYQTRQVMNFIKNSIQLGEFELYLDDNILGGHTKLFEEDYVFFEKLGYKVKRPETKVWVPSFIDLNYNEFYKCEKVEYFTDPAVISWHEEKTET